jgi:hypothetical protein
MAGILSRVKKMMRAKGIRGPQKYLMIVDSDSCQKSWARTGKQGNRAGGLTVKHLPTRSPDMSVPDQLLHDKLEKKLDSVIFLFFYFFQVTHKAHKQPWRTVEGMYRKLNQECQVETDEKKIMNQVIAAGGDYIR